MEVTRDRIEEAEMMVKEARAWLAVLIDNPDKTVSVDEYKAQLKDAKKAISNAEEKVRLAEHIAKVVAEWPTPEPWMVRRVTLLLRGSNPGPVHTPDSPKVIAVRKAEESLAKVRMEYKEAMDSCHGCGLSRKVHAYQKGYSTGYHDFAELSPDGAIKVAQAYKKKISSAEQALERARGL